MDGVITFYSQTQTQDANGVWQRGSETSREVFCQVDSVSRSEFFAGGQTGLRPEYRFTVFHGEYNGEKECVYNGARYAIYRSYHVPDTDYLELYAERRPGVISPTVTTTSTTVTSTSTEPGDADG